MTNGANHAGVISVGDLDGWTFSAAQGDYIALSMARCWRVRSIRSSCHGSVCSGRMAISSARRKGHSPRRLQPTAPLSGLYTVVVSDSAISREPSHLDNYILTLSKTNATLTMPDDDQGGPMTNGANHAGSITSAIWTAWTFTATLGDYIALSIGETLQSEIDPLFVPWIRLIGPTGVLISSSIGNLATQIAANAPLSGLYTVIVSDSAISREPSHVSTYVLTLAKTSTAITVPDGDNGGAMLWGALLRSGNVGDLGPIYIRGRARRLHRDQDWRSGAERD